MICLFTVNFRVDHFRFRLYQLNNRRFSHLAAADDSMCLYCLCFQFLQMHVKEGKSSMNWRHMLRLCLPWTSVWLDVKSEFTHSAREHYISFFMSYITLSQYEKKMLLHYIMGIVGPHSRPLKIIAIIFNINQCIYIQSALSNEACFIYSHGTKAAPVRRIDRGGAAASGESPAWLTLKTNFIDIVWFNK